MGDSMGYTYILMLVIVGALLPEIDAHGRLIEPPSRASAWRVGFNTPPNYDDNQLYCGGKQYQWEQQGGRCGVCGDPWGGSREHEAGGRYATGTIVRNYQPGQVIEVKVDLTANHKGWFEFRLCPVNNPNRRATQNCLNRYKLRLANGGGTRLAIRSDMKVVTVPLRLPARLTCSQCVLQWKYNAGNSWGTDPITGRGCTGCGAQEQFYGCADIAIGHKGQENDRRESTRPHYRPRGDQHGNRESGRGQEDDRRQSSANGRGQGEDRRQSSANWRGQGEDRRQSSANGRGHCRATGAWAGQSAMNDWCVSNCAVGNCPPSHCRCG